MGIRPDDGGAALPRINAFLEDLLARRGLRSSGFNNIRLVELNGGRIVEPTAFEPDPSTYRGEFYYNAINNVLYRKIVTRREPGIVVAYWQKISD